MKKKIKQRTSLLLASIMLLSTVPAPLFATQNMASTQPTEVMLKLPFQDIPDDAWYYDSVLYAVQKNLFAGTSGTEFSPNANLTRAMYVTVMSRIAGVNLVDYSGQSYFVDVDATEWYAPAVAWAAETGITGGMGEGKFEPNLSITREQMAVLTVKFFDTYGITYPEATVITVPNDIEMVSDYAKDAVQKLWACGLFSGDESGDFNPKAHATRAEAAAFCVRIDQTLEKQKENREDDKLEEEDTEEDDDESYDESYQVVFMDGDRRVKAVWVDEGDSLAELPTNEETSKEGYTFVGWYIDEGLKTPFYKDDEVTRDLKVYAKYEGLPQPEITLSSFAQVDMDPDVSFEVVESGDSQIAIQNAVTLIPKDGSDPVPLDIIPSGSGYTIRARGGFNEGSSYELTLADGYAFKDKAESIRTASFTIVKEEVANLGFNDEIVYIQDTDEMTYLIDGQVYDMITIGLVMDSETELLEGTFQYSGDKTELTEGTILCIYEDTHPEKVDYIRDSSGSGETAYIKVESVSGDTVSFEGLDAEDAQNLYFIPDTFPILVSEFPTGNTGTVSFDALDKQTFVALGKSLGSEEDTEVKVGDFVALYVDSSAVESQDDVYYGKITAYDEATKEITYTRSSYDEIEASMDLFLSQGVDGDELLEGVDRAALEDSVRAQVEASGFGEDAAMYLAGMATQTEGFRNIKGIEDVVLTDEDGNPLTNEQIAALGLGGNFELIDGIEVTVELETDSDKLHFGDGVRLGVGIDAQFEVDVNGDSVKIDLNATFIQEVAVDVDVNAVVGWTKVIPFPKSFKINTAIDLKNYSAVSMDVKVYTVAAEDEGLWETLHSLTSDPKWKSTFEAIEELENKIHQAKGTYEQLQGYKEDLKAVWASIPEDVMNPEEWETLTETLGQLNITEELMAMMNLTSETELDAGMKNLMEQYSEMLSKETDWIKLFEESIMSFQKCYYGIYLGAEVNFVIRGNISLALGTNLEYEMGKRYSFWIDIFGFKSGSSEMDLLDERFAFQFYVMGKLGLKMGVEAEITVGLIWKSLLSASLSAELGVYIKLYGFFIYEFSKLRPENTSTWIYDERMAGALYLEFGLYFIMSVSAQAIGINLADVDFVDLEIPLVRAGDRYFHYDFATELEEDEVVRIQDSDNNSNTGITMQLPESYLDVAFIALDSGEMGSKGYDYDRYHVSLSNRHFDISPDGLITVEVPEGVQYMTCDLTLTWKHNKLAFSTKDMSLTIPLIWTNLSDSELKEYFTASVRVGNPIDGYTTVWRKRLQKNEPFNLPTEEAILEAMHYDDYALSSGKNLKYAAVQGYDASQQMEDLAIYTDTTYDFDAEIEAYTLRVDAVQNEDGTTESHTLIAKYGEAFDLSELNETGTDKPHENPDEAAYTKYVTVQYSDEEVDLTSPIDITLAQKLLKDAGAQAIYAQDSVRATFDFVGIQAPQKVMKLRKGDTPFFDHSIVTEQGAMVTEIMPVITPIFTDTVYDIVCAFDENAVFYTIDFEENGGSEVPTVKYPEGSVIIPPIEPVKEGYTFGGWYQDEALTQLFEWDKMPGQALTLYAKWGAETYQVTLEGNGGTFGEENTKIIEVTLGEPYPIGEIPEQFGKGLVGWTLTRDGEDFVATNEPATLAKKHTLYAKWGDLIVIDKDTVTFEGIDDLENGNVYDTEAKEAIIGNYPEDFFKVEYRRNDDNEWREEAVNAGLYSIKVSLDKPGYQVFEKTMQDVMVIEKAPSVFKLDFLENDPDADDLQKANQLEVEVIGNNFFVTPLQLGEHYIGDGKIEYSAVKQGEAINNPSAGWYDTNQVTGLAPGTYAPTARIPEGENYKESVLEVISGEVFQVDSYRMDPYVYNVSEEAGYTYKANIKTADEKNAGTDAKVFAGFGTAKNHDPSGVYGDYFHLNGSGNDFERGDEWEYRVNALNRGINAVEPHDFNLYFQETWHLGAAWKCAWVDVRLYQGNQMLDTQRINVDRWFDGRQGQSYPVQLQRTLTDMGVFNTIPKDIMLTEDSAADYTFTFDGTITDSFLQTYNPFNVYAQKTSLEPTSAVVVIPTWTIRAEGYEDFITQTVDGFTIDQAGLREVMLEDGVDEATIEVELYFNDPSIKEGSRRQTKTIHVTLKDQREILEVGNFEELPEVRVVDEATTEGYTFTFDGAIKDSVNGEYNVYNETIDPSIAIKPTFEVEAGDYQAYVTTHDRGFAIDQKGMYDALNRNSTTSSAIQIKMNFDDELITQRTRTWEHTLTVSTDNVLEEVIKISQVGNFEVLDDVLDLTGGTQEAYTFSFDGQIKDVLGNRYDVYESGVINEPKWRVDGDYSEYVTLHDKGFSIDQVGLYEDMLLNNTTSSALTIEMRFDDERVDEQTRSWEHRITITLPELETPKRYALADKGIKTRYMI